MSDGVPLVWAEDDTPREDAAVLGWHDHETFQGRVYPVLWHEGGRTEPCIWCGRSHTHGDEDGFRVPHCGTHTHDRTPTGRPRSTWAKGVTVCRVHHRQYILRRKP